MKTFLIKDNDLVFDNQGDLMMVEGDQEQIQGVERLLTANVNEFFLEITHGFDYSLLKTKQPDSNLIRLGLIDAITQDTKVDNISNLIINLDNATRKLTVNFKILLVSGNTVESEVSL
ncbi:MAG: DUF2634 domain-containing protein [Eubacteriaceae bacterium]|nr:DUF2634 domain-containing protein [Eubacteriaceae bacterium]